MWSIWRYSFFCIIWHLHTDEPHKVPTISKEEHTYSFVFFYISDILFTWKKLIATSYLNSWNFWTVLLKDNLQDFPLKLLGFITIKAIFFGKCFFFSSLYLYLFYYKYLLSWLNLLRHDQWRWVMRNKQKSIL